MSESAGRSEGETGADGPNVILGSRIQAAEKVARHWHAQSVRGALAGDINATRRLHDRQPAEQMPAWCTGHATLMGERFDVLTFGSSQL
jgi:hypothetical protein